MQLRTALPCPQARPNARRRLVRCRRGYDMVIHSITTQDSLPTMREEAKHNMSSASHILVFLASNTSTLNISLERTPRDGPTPTQERVRTTTRWSGTLRNASSSIRHACCEAACQRCPTLKHLSTTASSGRHQKRHLRDGSNKVTRRAECVQRAEELVKAAAVRTVIL